MSAIAPSLELSENYSPEIKCKRKLHNSGARMSLALIQLFVVNHPTNPVHWAGSLDPARRGK